MGHVVVRAPRRLQDINSVILPSLARRPSRKIPQANRFFSSKIPRANRGSFLPESPPPIPYVAPTPPSIWDVNRQCVCTSPSCVLRWPLSAGPDISFSFETNTLLFSTHKSCSNLQTSSNQINPNVQKVILSTNISTMVTKWPKPNKL